MSQPPKGDVIAYVTSVLTPGDVCIDGGANTGTVTEAMAKAVGPTGRVYAVEPDSRCHNALEGLAEQYGCVRPIPMALTMLRGPIMLQLGQQTQQSSVVRAALEGDYGEDLVLGASLDAMTDQPVALVKLDLQGGEWAALHGASRAACAAGARRDTRGVLEVLCGSWADVAVDASAAPVYTRDVYLVVGGNKTVREHDRGTMTDEREDLQALMQAPGWARLLAVARAQWAGEGYGRQIKLAIATAQQQNKDVSAAVSAVDAASEAVNQLMTYPQERVRELDTKQAQATAAERGQLSRRGGL